MHIIINLFLYFKMLVFMKNNFVEMTKLS